MLTFGNNLPALTASVSDSGFATREAARPAVRRHKSWPAGWFQDGNPAPRRGRRLDASILPIPATVGELATEVGTRCHDPPCGRPSGRGVRSGRARRMPEQSGTSKRPRNGRTARTGCGTAAVRLRGSSAAPVRSFHDALGGADRHWRRSTVRLVTAAGRRLMPNRHGRHAARTQGRCDDARGRATTGSRPGDRAPGNRSTHAASCCRVKMQFRTSMMLRASWPAGGLRRRARTFGSWVVVPLPSVSCISAEQPQVGVTCWLPVLRRSFDSLEWL